MPACEDEPVVFDVHLVDGTYELFRYHYAPNNRDATLGATRGVVGSAYSVSAPSPQHFNKSIYNFISWSDGGPQSHTITAPSVNTTYTAMYRKR